METNETLLIHRCLAGDDYAPDELVVRYHMQVFRLAVSILDDSDEAEDAAQDVFLNALTHLSQYRQEASFKTWLFSITINVCRKRLRKKALLLRLKQIVQHITEMEGILARAPEERVIDQQTNILLWRAVQALPENERIAMILHYYSNLSIEEMQAVLKISRRTVYYRLDRGHQYILQMLEKEAG